MRPMLPPYVVLQKELGQTPLQAIDAWRAAHPAHTDVPATYAGRLDPMATGGLLVLLGDECKRQEAYRSLDKEYEIEVLLDLSTDTGDALGMPTYAGAETHPSSEEIDQSIEHSVGTKEVPYPAFSSKTVNGKPLFLYALEGVLATITIPTHEERIYRIRHLGSRAISKEALLERIETLLSHAPRTMDSTKELGADFRQDAIRAAWRSTLSSLEDRSFTILTLSVTCASGTYMRTLAARIAATLGTQGLALSIHRTKVGRYRPLFGRGLWTTRYR